MTRAVVLLGTSAILMMFLACGRGYSPDTQGIDKAKREIQLIVSAVERHRIETGRLPESLAELSIRNDSGAQFQFKDGVPPNPWGRPYSYGVVNDTEYFVIAIDSPMTSIWGTVVQYRSESGDHIEVLKRNFDINESELMETVPIRN